MGTTWELPADLLSLEARAKRAAHAAVRFCADPRCDCTALDLRPEPEVQRNVSAELGVRAVACLESLLALTGTDGWNGSFALDDALEEAREVLACAWTLAEPLHASPSPSASGDTRAESVAQVPASVKGEVRSWDRSGCREAVCYCHDEASAPRFCGHCGCRPEQAQVSP